MTTTAATTDIFSAWDQFDTDVPFVAEVVVVEAPAIGAHCTRCGRTLRSATSIAVGMGRTCARKIAEAAKSAAMTATQAVKVTDALESGAVTHRVRNLFQVVSSDGGTVYDVDLAAGSCTCKAGQYRRACYHLASAAVLSAA